LPKHDGGYSAIILHQNTIVRLMVDNIPVRLMHGIWTIESIMLVVLYKNY